MSMLPNFLPLSFACFLPMGLFFSNRVWSGGFSCHLHLMLHRHQQF
jgi:hypothetical protein